MKILILGFGSIGKKHYLALKDKHEIAILSKSAAKTKELKIYRKFDELDLNIFDAFIIANITTSHFDTLKMLNSKVKGKIILVEKPLFEKNRVFKSSRNHIFVAYLLRFHPLITYLKTLLKNEKIYFAKLVCNSYLPHWRDCDYRKNYSAKKELGGGVLLDLSHELDLAFYLFGKLKLEFAQNLKISELKIDSDDFAFLALKNKNAKIHIQLDYFSKFIQRQIHIHTLKRSFKADLVGNELEIYDTKNKLKKISFKNDTIYNLKIMHKALFEKDENLCSLKEAKEVLKLCDEVKNGFMYNLC